MKTRAQRGLVTAGAGESYPLSASHNQASWDASSGPHCSTSAGRRGVVAFIFKDQERCTPFPTSHCCLLPALPPAFLRPGGRGGDVFWPKPAGMSWRPLCDFSLLRQSLSHCLLPSYQTVPALGDLWKGTLITGAQGSCSKWESKRARTCR